MFNQLNSIEKFKASLITKCRDLYKWWDGYEREKDSGFQRNILLMEIKPRLHEFYKMLFESQFDIGTLMQTEVVFDYYTITIEGNLRAFDSLAVAAKDKYYQDDISPIFSNFNYKYPFSLDHALSYYDAYGVEVSILILGIRPFNSDSNVSSVDFILRDIRVITNVMNAFIENRLLAKGVSNSLAKLRTSSMGGETMVTSIKMSGLF